MNLKYVWNHHRWFVILSACYAVSRLFYLDTDFHFLEPDEVIYYDLARQFGEVAWPWYEGKIYLEQFPLFPMLSSVLNWITSWWGTLIGVRLLSVIGAGIAGWGLYYYADTRNNRSLGLTAAAIYWLFPLSIFYSRSGTYDMFFIGLVVASWAIFVTPSTQSTFSRFGQWLKAIIAKPNHSWDANRLVLFSALLFVAAILTKTLAIVFLLSFVILADSNFGRYKELFLNWFAIVASLILFVVGLYWVGFGDEFWLQLSDLPARHMVAWWNIRLHTAVLWEYLRKIDWYLSWPGVVSLLLGLGYLGYQKTQFFSRLLDWWVENFCQWLAWIQRKKIPKSTVTLPALGHQLIEVGSLLLPALIGLYLFDFSPRYALLDTASLRLNCCLWISFVRQTGIYSDSFTYDPIWISILAINHAYLDSRSVGRCDRAQVQQQVPSNL